MVKHVTSISVLSGRIVESQTNHEDMKIKSWFDHREHLTFVI
jgi:hypothetical protein